jgi:hypothetical protein
MIIDPDVRGVAKRFTNVQEFAALMQAVVNAEGDIVKAVRCSDETVTTREKALEVLARSIVHRLLGYVIDGGHRAEFVTYFGSKWAPLGVANDPKNLNQFWSKNVTKLWA